MPQSWNTQNLFALVALICLAARISAHSWVEQLTVINPNGTFTGNPGFARGNVKRGPGFSDPLMVNLLPPNGRPGDQGILKSDLMCKDTQRKPVQTDGSPRLQAAAGSLVALRYQENGHVTLPQNQLGKPPNRGTVFIYGTSQPQETDTLLDIHKQWNSEGTGGDKRGKLLAKQPFDDGRCYQINGGSISTSRQANFPHPANQLMGSDLWCQNDIALPSDAPNGKPYTLYWVWEWPTAPNVDPGLPKGKEETYTTCMDIDITGQPERNNVKLASDIQQKNAGEQPGIIDISNAAIPDYLKALDGGSFAQASAREAGPDSATSASPIVLPSSATTGPPTITVTASPKVEPVTVTVTESPAGASPTTPAQTQPASTKIITVPRSTVTQPGPTISSITTLAGPSPSKVGQKIPTSLVPVIDISIDYVPATSATSSPQPSNSPRCLTCKMRRRSRIFGRSHHH